MRVDHRRLHIAMSKQLLNQTNIFSALQQVCREGVSKGVACDALGKSRLVGASLHRVLHVGVVEVVSLYLS